MNKIKNPEIEKHLVVSTIHISKEDSDLLDFAIRNPISKVGMYLSLDRYDYGYRVFVGTEKAYIDKKSLIDIGFSKEFYILLKIAYDLKCKFLCLDGDGTVYKELKKFDW